MFLLPLLAVPASAADWNSAAQPVYTAAESFTDGVYAFLSRSGEGPRATSYELFSGELQGRQERAERLIAGSMPVGPASSGDIAVWGGRAVAEEAKALTDTFASTFAQRYEVKPFSLVPGDSAADGDAGRFASTALFGAAYAYAAGVRADLAAGPVRFDIDVNSGRALRRSSEGGPARRLASLRVSPRNSPLYLETVWGIREGRVGRESLGLNYSRHF
jgi:hypothetical protein